MNGPIQLAEDADIIISKIRNRITLSYDEKIFIIRYWKAKSTVDDMMKQCGFNI